MASDSSEETDLGPFAHECEAAVCRQVMGGRAHGLDTVLSVAW